VSCNAGILLTWGEILGVFSVGILLTGVQVWVFSIVGFVLTWGAMLSVL